MMLKEYETENTDARMVSAGPITLLSPGDDDDPADGEGDWSDIEDEDFEDIAEDRDDLNQMELDNDIFDPDDDDHLPDDDD